MNEQKQYDGTLLVGPDEKLPFAESIFLGLQHLLAMDIYVVPFIIAGLLLLVGFLHYCKRVFSCVCLLPKGLPMFL